MTVTVEQLRFAHGDITHNVIGAFYDVYNGIGYGHPETVYANAMPIALNDRGVRYRREAPCVVRFRGIVVGEFRADLMVEDRVIVELKAVDSLNSAHISQVTNYLRASGLTVGMLFNFGPTAQTRRVIWTGARSETLGLLDTEKQSRIRTEHSG